MKTHSVRSFSQLLPIAALLLASGLLQAAEPPRVMFVSGLDVQPVIIDLQGKELPAKKGMIIKPGFSVKVPEGATVQIMTDEKAIIAVRPNSLLKLEKLGEGTQPHRFKLDLGGLRVANSEKKPHKFEVDTPNAKVKFDKGDHEAYYLKEGKLTDGRWGTFVRGMKDESVLSTKDGDMRITKRDVGFVPGSGKERTQLIARIDTSGNTVADPITYIPGASGRILTDLNDNQRVLSETKPSTPEFAALSPNVKSLTTLVPLPVVKSYTPPQTITPPTFTAMVTPIAGLISKLAMPDLKTIAGVSSVKPVLQDLAVKPEVVLAKDPTGLTIPIAITQQGDLIANTPIITTAPKVTTTISGTEVQTILSKDITSQTLLCLRC